MNFSVVGTALALISLISLLDLSIYVRAQQLQVDGRYYSSRYDNLDVETLFQSSRLLSNYIDCLLEKKPCPPEGKELKRMHIPHRGLSQKSVHINPFFKLFKSQTNRIMIESLLSCTNLVIFQLLCLIFLFIHFFFSLCLQCKFKHPTQCLMSALGRLKKYTEIIVENKNISSNARAS